MTVGCLYRPPWADNIWIGGDFNLPHTDWVNLSATPGNSCISQTETLIHAVNDHSLTQVIDCATRKNNLLDLLFTTRPSLVNQCGCIPPLGEADHDIVFVDLNTRATIPKKSPTTRLLYHKADWEGMAKNLNGLILPAGDIQHKWDFLESTLQSLVKKFVPARQSRPNDQKPWVTSELKTLFHKCDRAFKRQKKDLRHKAQKEERAAYRTYIDSIFDLDSGSSTAPSDKSSVLKRFWSFVKSKKKNSCGVAPLRKNGTLVSDAKGKADILNQQYSSVFASDDPQTAPSKGERPFKQMDNISITTEGVLKLLKGLNPNKASGPDKISPKLLKNMADYLAQPLASLFQASLEQGKVPHQWKNALVTPIFKKGNKHDAANYRPVSLTSVCCKLLEHIVAKSVMEHLDVNNILSDSQYGFRAKRSCETQLVTFIDELQRHLAKDMQIDLAILDFSKAFDVVPHSKLLYKLDYYGIRGLPLEWIRSFLNDRVQRVAVDDKASDVAPVISGVPQGSVLGPILFLVFINDMPECINSKCRLFADNSIVYRTITSVADSIAIQKDLDSLHEWEVTWGMSFNSSKCNTMNIARKTKVARTDYTLKGEVLKCVESALYLGVTISSNLTWNHHIKTTAAKANKTLGFVKRNLKGASKKAKILAYQTLVRPKLEYCSTVWAPHHQQTINQSRNGPETCSQICGTQVW